MAIKMVDYILSLDPGNEMGWALSDGKKILKSGLEIFSKKGILTDDKKAINMYNWLSNFILKNGLTFKSSLVFEESFINMKYASAVKPLHFYQSAICLAATHSGILQIEGYTPMEIKSFCKLKKKKDIVEWVKRKGYKPTDHNEADAIVLNLLEIERYQSSEEVTEDGILENNVRLGKKIKK